MNDTTIMQILVLYLLVCVSTCSYQYWIEKEGPGWKKYKWYEKGFLIIMVGFTIPVVYLVAYVQRNFKKIARSKKCIKT